MGRKLLSQELQGNVAARMWLNVKPKMRDQL